MIFPLTFTVSCPSGQCYSSWIYLYNNIEVNVKTTLVIRYGLIWPLKVLHQNCFCGKNEQLLDDLTKPFAALNR